MSELSAEGLVLRRRPYSESSLLIALLTRDAGVVNLLVRGGAARAKAGRDVIDVLRLVQVEWRPSRTSDLHTARSVIVLDSFESIAGQPAAFATIGWLARFILGHCECGGSHPALFAAMLSILQRSRLDNMPPPAAIWTAVMLTLAREEGQLPDFPPDDLRKINTMIAAAACPDMPFPAYDPETWIRGRDWCARLLQHAGFTLPDGWQKLGT